MDSGLQYTDPGSGNDLTRIQELSGYVQHFYSHVTLTIGKCLEFCSSSCRYETESSWKGRHQLGYVDVIKTHMVIWMATVLR